MLARWLRRLADRLDTPGTLRAERRVIIAGDRRALFMVRLGEAAGIDPRAFVMNEVWVLEAVALAVELEVSAREQEFAAVERGLADGTWQ